MSDNAIDQALSILPRSPLARCPDGYGEFPFAFISMRTARQFVFQGMATCSGKVGDKNTVLSIAVRMRNPDKYDPADIRNALDNLPPVRKRGGYIHGDGDTEVFDLRDRSWCPGSCSH